MKELLKSFHLNGHLAAMFSFWSKKATDEQITL